MIGIIQGSWRSGLVCRYRLKIDLEFFCGRARVRFNLSVSRCSTEVYKWESIQKILTIFTFLWMICWRLNKKKDKSEYFVVNITQSDKSVCRVLIIDLTSVLEFSIKTVKMILNPYRGLNSPRNGMKSEGDNKWSFCMWSDI